MIEGILLILVGLFSVAGAAMNWRFFMSNHRAQFFVRTFGYDGARIFYVALGLVIAGIGAAILVKDSTLRGLIQELLALLDQRSRSHA